MNQLGEGAEAIVYLEDGKAVKLRQKKSYRIAEIDEKLRLLRTRREAKLIAKIHQLGFGPALVSSDEKKATLSMEFLDGKKVRDLLKKSNCRQLSRQIGKIVAELHNHNIIHSDLTTSNMLIIGKKIYLVDFGLSFESSKAEDKAVDIHLLRQALESKHHLIWKESFHEFLSAYKRHSSDPDAILARLEKVEKRGRNKSKGS